MGILEEQLRGESLADYTNEQLRISLNTALYTNTADMWKRYLEQQGYSGSVADMMAKWWAANNVPPQFRNYINSGLYLFNPRQLFQDGSVGVLYDNNDLTSFYLDAAMTTQATVNGLVGAQADKSGGNRHRTQTTTGSKPILRGTPTGAELFTAYGTPGAGWSVAGATGTATTASSALPTTTAATVGKHYRVTYTVTRSAGSVQLSFGGRTGVSRSAAGQYVEYFDNALNTNALTATGTGFTGTVRIDEVKDVSAGSVTAPYGLQYDGVDDFLQTASVNFSATDKMFVCAGVRKFTNTAGIVAELSSSFTANAGTFYLISGIDGVYDYSSISRGTAAAAPAQAGGIASIAAPDTSVLSSAHDIAGDLTTFRRNSVAATSGTADKGTGNYGNYAMYFGRRAGVSLPYNGLDFGFVIVGKTLTAAQISSTERWMAQRTGVTL